MNGALLLAAVAAIAAQQNPVQDVQNWFNSGAQWAWQQLQGAFGWAWQQITSLFGGIVESIRNAVMGVISSMGQTFSGVVNAIAEPFRALFAGFSKIITAGVESVVAFAGGNPLVATLYFLVIPAIIVAVIAILWRGGRKAIGI